jgi:hypothetical protein
MAACLRGHSSQILFTVRNLHNIRVPWSYYYHICADFRDFAKLSCTGFAVMQEHKLENDIFLQPICTHFVTLHGLYIVYNKRGVTLHGANTSMISSLTHRLIRDQDILHDKIEKPFYAD